MAAGSDERRQAYLGKARHELSVLAEAGILTVGNAFGCVVLAKGELDADELSGEAPLLSGADGTALRAALTALGYAPEDWCGVATRHADGRPLGPNTLRRVLSTLDPATLVACDEPAAAAMRNAFADELSVLDAMEAALLAPGVVAQVAGMRVLNLGGFAAALADTHEKQRMWRYLKQIPPLGEPY